MPRYVYDLAGLSVHASAIRAALPPGVELLYAMKANPDAAILPALESHVDGFEAASGGEVKHLATALPGVAPAALGGPGKTDAELTTGLLAGVRRFHVESVNELRRLSALAVAHGTRADVLLRVNLPVDVNGASLVMAGFGMDPADAVACASADLPGIRVRGVHAHLASGLDAVAAASTARQIVAWAISTLDAREVNVGGGMAVDYGLPSALFDWKRYGEALPELPGVTLRIEPGRSLTAYCGVYETVVVDVKTVGGQRFAIVEGGTHHLRTPAAKGHSQPFTIVPGGEGPGSEPGPLVIAGQLCTPKDVLASCASAPSLSVGDVVRFEMAGAYAWNISHHDFLMHDPPSFSYLS